MNEKMGMLVNNMEERLCRNQLKVIAYKVALAMADGEKQVVISPIFDENLKTVIVTYEATVTRAKERNGLMLDILSWAKDLPREAFKGQNCMSNFFEKPICFDEFKQLVEMKKVYEMKMRDAEKNKV